MLIMLNFQNLFQNLGKRKENKLIGIYYLFINFVEISFNGKNLMMDLKIEKGISFHSLYVFTFTALYNLQQC